MNAKLTDNPCAGCGQCAEVCPEGCFSHSANAYEVIFDGDNCIGCGECVAICPAGAVELKED